MKVWLTLEYDDGKGTKFAEKINMPFPPSVGMEISSNTVKGVVKTLCWDTTSKEMTAILDRETVFVLKMRQWVRP